MHQRNRQLVQALGMTGLAFLVIALVIGFRFTPPSLTLLIDRSYCPTSQWQNVVAQYEQLYQQQDEVKLKAVVLFSALGEEVRSSPPAPSEIAALSTYGQTTSARQQQVQQSYANSRILECQ